MKAIRRFTIRLLLSGAFVALVAIGAADAAAPPGQYTASGGTVYDTKTKLTWQQQITSGTTYPWANAKTYCTSAAVTALGGVGWRLPTLKELLTLVDFKQSTGASIDQTFFPGVPESSYFWSSTPLAGSTSSGWIVYFGSGYPSSSNGSNFYNVRCVR
jgi:hypothetical protein